MVEKKGYCPKNRRTTHRYSGNLSFDVVPFSAFVHFVFPLCEYGLLSLIGTLPILYIWLYYQMWSISFSERQITIKHFLRKAKIYTYSQIKDGRISNSYTLHQNIFLRFSDGRSCLFRLEYENAKNALKIIQTHSSLRNDI